jgi:hypothetical protein
MKNRNEARKTRRKKKLGDKGNKWEEIDETEKL